MIRHLGVLTVLSAASTASATSLFYDGFDYPEGTSLKSNSPPWINSTPNQVNNLVTVAPGSLSYAGLPTTGNHAQWLALSSDTPSVSLGTPITSGTVYFSLVLNFAASFAPTNNNQAYFAGFDNSASGSSFASGAALVSKRNADNPALIDLGIAAPGNQNLTKKYGPVPYSTSDVLFVVGSYTFNGDTTTDDVQNLYVFANGEVIPTAVPSTPTATTSTASADLPQIARFYLRSNTGEPGTMNADEVRVGTTWADILPLPGDARLSGRIDGDDYSRLDLGFARYQAGLIAPGTATWGDGDFNGDKIVDAADYTIINQSLAAQSGGGGSAPALSVIPEPGCLALVALSVLACPRRR